MSLRDLASMRLCRMGGLRMGRLWVDDWGGEVGGAGRVVLVLRDRNHFYFSSDDLTRRQEL